MGRVFPGIDPYIEAQGLWQDFHTSYLTYCRDQLVDRLPETYTARLEERYVVLGYPDERARVRRSDLAVERQPREGSWRPVGGGVGGGVVVLEPALLTLPLVMEEIREVWIEIRQIPGRELVTVIELLSPTNKQTGAGFSSYLAKRSELINQPIHVVEIDLLLGGERLPMHEPLPAGDCYVFVSRSERRPKSEVYAWSVRRVLPAIPIPLKSPDADVWLDLDAAYAIAYEKGRYARDLQYGAELKLPLGEAERAWVEELARGARSGSA
jgi:hypothetical protein